MLDEEDDKTSLMRKPRQMTIYDALPEKDDGEEEEEIDDLCLKKCPHSQFFCPTGFCVSLREIFLVTWQTVMTQICMSTPCLVALAFAGHTADQRVFSSTAIAVTAIHSLIIIISLGAGTACDTFFSQSFGSKNKRQMGLWLQRALLVNLLAVLVAWAVQMNSQWLLLFVGQTPEVARRTSRYLLIFMPSTLAIFINTVLMKFLQCQGNLIPSVIFGILINLLNIILQYLLVYTFDIHEEKEVGSAIALTVSYFWLPFMHFACIFFSGKTKDVWSGWSHEAIRDWGAFCVPALGGLLMGSLEWFGLEASVFLAGYVSGNATAAQAILYQLLGFWDMYARGFRIGLTMFMGRLIGSEQSTKAKTTIFTGLVMIVVSSLVFAVILFTARTPILKMMTHHSDIHVVAEAPVKIVCLIILLDSIVCCGEAILDSTGRQIIGAGMAIICFYFIGYPIGISLLLLTDFGLMGFYYGYVVYFLAMCCGMTILFAITNWGDECRYAQVRAGLEAEEELNMKERRIFDAWSLSKVIICRSFLVVGCLLILACGILIKFLVKVPSGLEEDHDHILVEKFLNSSHICAASRNMMNKAGMIACPYPIMTFA